MTGKPISTQRMADACHVERVEHHAACLGSCQACQACRWTLAIYVGAWRSMPVTPATQYLAHFAGAAEPSRSLISRAGLVADAQPWLFPGSSGHRNLAWPSEANFYFARSLLPPHPSRLATARQTVRLMKRAKCLDWPKVVLL